MEYTKHGPIPVVTQPQGAPVGIVMQPQGAPAGVVTQHQEALVGVVIQLQGEPVDIVIQSQGAPIGVVAQTETFLPGVATQMLILSSIQIAMGTICAAFGFVLVTDTDLSWTGSELKPSGYGAWIGAFYALVGVMGIVSASRNTTHWVNKTFLVMDSLMLVIGLVEFVITIWCAALCCGAVCKAAPIPTQVVQHKTTPAVLSRQTVMYPGAPMPTYTTYPAVQGQQAACSVKVHQSTGYMTKSGQPRSMTAQAGRNIVYMLQPALPNQLKGPPAYHSIRPDQPPPAAYHTKL